MWDDKLQSASNDNTFGRAPSKRMSGGRKGSNSSIVSRYDDSGSVAGDDLSERYSRRNARTVKLISSLMIWLKNVNKMRAVMTSKGFYKWKYAVASPLPAPMPTPLQREIENDLVELENHSKEMKSNYLAMFAENEKLREQIAEMKKQHNSVDRRMRIQAGKMVISSILKKRLSMKVRYYYDTWICNTTLQRLVADTTHRSMALAVGLQQVESERNYVRQTEEANYRLRMLLSLTIYFLKWKSKASGAVLVEERKMHEQQRKVIFQELRRMRSVVAFANEQEQVLMQGAVKRGDEANDHLTQVKERISQIVQASRQYKAHLPEDIEQTMKRMTISSQPASSIAPAASKEETRSVGEGKRTPDRMKSSRKQQQQQNVVTSQASPQHE